jgi:hypothetical protein
MPWSSPAPPGTQPPLSPAEMDLLVARTGLTLNPGQMADLVLAWRQLAGLIAGIPRSSALADDQAFVFRLPAPVPETAPRKASPKPKPAAKPKPVAKKTAAKKSSNKNPLDRKSAARKPVKPARKR